MNCSSRIQVLFFLVSLCFLNSHEIVNSSSSTGSKLRLAFNETQNFVKNVSRARLWSPYSTIAFQLDSNASSVSLESTLSLQEKTPNTSTRLLTNDNQNKVNHTLVEVKDDSSITAPRQSPIISSIRHYKSRKSFSRTLKPSSSKHPSDSDSQPQHWTQESKISTSASKIYDLDFDPDLQSDYQGDQRNDYASEQELSAEKSRFSPDLISPQDSNLSPSDSKIQPGNPRDFPEESQVSPRENRIVLGESRDFPSENKFSPRESRILPGESNLPSENKFLSSESQISRDESKVTPGESKFLHRENDLSETGGRFSPGEITNEPNTKTDNISSHGDPKSGQTEVEGQSESGKESFSKKRQTPSKLEKVPENYIYGSPDFVPRNRTKSAKKLNRIISLLSRNDTKILNSDLSKKGPGKGQRNGATPRQRPLESILGPSPRPNRIKSRDGEILSSNREKQQRRRVPTRLRSDTRSLNNGETLSNYDDEIPLVFIPGHVPSFGESGESYDEDVQEESKKGVGFSQGFSPGFSSGFSPEDDYYYESRDKLGESATNDEKREDMDIVTKFLRMVEEKTADNCTAGTDLKLGQGVVDRYAQERFQREAEVAVNRANMLTRLWKYAREVMNSEYLVHASVFSMVEFDDDIFAAGNCYDEKQYKNYTLFCAFAYRLPDGNIRVKDLAVEYKYSTNTSEFFFAARTNAARVIKNFNQFTRGFHSYTYNESAHTEITEEIILNVTYEDGKWSEPYFDCGGGNIWMMTYAVPFFDFQNNTYFFKGTSGIDIDLRRVDIDQCPANSTENIFAGSDKCKNSTTKCVPRKGLGFRRGSYRCECKVGFYFPNVTSPDKYFNGSLLEEEYENKFMGRVTRYDEPGAFECVVCPYGCDECIDDSPCIVTLNWLMRSAILGLQIVIILMLPIVGLFTWKYAEVKVIRAASPVLLGFIVLGAFFIYCTILVMYPNPSIITCTLRVWLREIGFSLAYGALMLKTWRISVIFRVRSAKAVKITDLDLMKRLGIIVAMFTALLVIRTLVAPPDSITHYTADNLKAWLCISDWWDHSFTIMELSFLVWGIRLCIVVRKAPSEFNESKFISLAIYNEFLLSLFLNISMLFLQSPPNPDLLYIIFFCHVQLTMTLLLCLIFGSKAYMVFRGHGKGGSSDESRNTTAKFITKNRGAQANKQASLSAQNSTGTGLHASLVSNALLQDPNSGARIPEDIQEEFQRFYSQLEELKERNVKLGNRQLVDKIMAMQAAAITLLSTVSDTDTNGLHCPASAPVVGSVVGSVVASSAPPIMASPKDIKGSTKSTSSTGGTPKSNLLLTHISEEENASSIQISSNQHKPLPTPAPSHPSTSKTEITNSPQIEENKVQAATAAVAVYESTAAVAEYETIISNSSVSKLPSTVCDVYGSSISTSGPESPEDFIPISTDEEDELEYMDVDDYEESDDVGDSIRNTLNRLTNSDSVAKSAGDAGDAEIHESIITSPSNATFPEKPEAEVQILESVKVNQAAPDLLAAEARGGAGNSSTGSGVKGSGGTSRGKIILDLDDKSRFTEEITV